MSQYWIADMIEQVSYTKELLNWTFGDVRCLLKKYRGGGESRRAALGPQLRGARAHV
jgi:hypothetical protein